jgi:short-subunit dehydrogenase
MALQGAKCVVLGATGEIGRAFLKHGAGAVGRNLAKLEQVKAEHLGIQHGLASAVPTD